MSSRAAPPASLCVVPWIHAFIETTGDVRLCCVARGENSIVGNAHRESIIKIFHSNKMAGIRQQMLQGEWPEDCAYCQQREAMHLESYRQHSNQRSPIYFEALASGVTPFPPRIHTIDLRLNNICNFKCRSCSGFASDRWFREHNLIYPENKISVKFAGLKDEHSFWEDFDRDIIGDLEEVNLAGGEPLIMNSHYLLLEKLIAAGKTGVHLRYDTNLSHLRFKHWDVIDLWKKFPNLTVSMSLDGTGEKGEYIREGLDYGKWTENVRRLKHELPHAHRCIHFVVSIFNVIDFSEHYRTMVEGDFVGRDAITFTFLEEPTFLSAQVLKPDLKAAVDSDLRELLASGSDIPGGVRSQISALIEFVHAKDLYTTHGAVFSLKTRVLDRLRGQNAAELFPALEPMLNRR